MLINFTLFFHSQSKYGKRLYYYINDIWNVTIKENVALNLLKNCRNENLWEYLYLNCTIIRRELNLLAALLKKKFENNASKLKMQITLLTPRRIQYFNFTGIYYKIWESSPLNGEDAALNIV